MRTCKVCGKKDVDMRHVMVECFYDVKEVVPEMKPDTIYKPVDMKGAYLGTSYMLSGTKDKYIYSKDKKGVIHIDTKPVKCKKMRLLETQGFYIDVCKSCRGGFLNVLKRWVGGEFVSSQGNGNIPIRENGATKFITMAEWNRRKHEKV